MSTAEDRIGILDMDLGELEGFLSELGEPPFRARQLFDWIYRRLGDDFDRMTNLPQSLREHLKAVCYVAPGTVVAEHTSRDGLTTKVLLRLLDGQTIESVLMQQVGAGGERRTVCVSSQVGCPIGCVFCATGRSGFARQLTAGEMVGQVLHFARRLADGGGTRPITHVVFMGQGEPLLNRTQLRRAVQTLNSPHGLNLGSRHITISTAGVVPGILELAGWPWQVGLAVSLHAPSDELRDRLVPLNRRYPLKELMAACRAYTQATRRRVTFEYTLIAELNDSPAQARALAALLKGELCHVNLIPLNPIPGVTLRPSPRRRVLAFQAELQQQGIPCTVRVERGSDVDAACGQLRRREIAERR